MKKVLYGGNNKIEISMDQDKGGENFLACVPRIYIFSIKNSPQATCHGKL